MASLNDAVQYAIRTLKTAGEIARKAYDMFYNPNPLDVQTEVYDENGNLIRATLPNRAKIHQDYEQWRSNVRKEYPVPPNLLKNTRFWLWPNEVVDANNPFGSNENVWVNNSLPLYWGWYNYADANGVVGDTTFRAKTIHVENQTAWVAEGLPDPSQIPLLNTSPPSGLNTHTYGGRYSRTLVLEITKTKGGTTFLNQDCAVYTSWNRGNVWLTTKIYFAILSRTGNITLKFMGNRFPSVDIGPQEQGRWHHATAHRYGFGGCIQGYVVGSGTIKVALMFPYVGVGYIPEDAHVWAGYVGSESAAYTHEDLVVSNNALAKGGM